MTASDYQINFPYGATSAPYSGAHPHRGDDRPCPAGTPIVIDGATIGLTGATGNVTGPHLHIQEWQNDYANTRKPQNAFQPGTVTNIDPAGTQGDGSFGKFITIQTADGWCDSYCHLSQINVIVGQEIGDKQVTVFESEQQVEDFYFSYQRRHATDEEKKFWVGQPIVDWCQNIMHNLLANIDDLTAKLAAESKVPTPEPAPAPVPEPVPLPIPAPAPIPAPSPSPAKPLIAGVIAALAALIAWFIAWLHS